MPCYERKVFFREALESALNQTVKCKIIVSDNCSSHNYFKQTCSEKGISYFRNETNIGLFANFNKCIEHSKTEYVLILGDDDILSPNYVETFLDALLKYPNLDIFFTNFFLNNLTTKKLYPHGHTLPFGYMQNGFKIIDYGIKYKLGFPLISSAIKKSKFTQFYTDFHGSNDWLWVYSNADKLAFYGDPRELYKYGIHDSQDSMKNRSNCILSFSYIYDEVLKNKASNKKDEKQARKNTFWALFMVKALGDTKTIKEWIIGDTLYGNYLKKKLNTDIFIKTIFVLPKGLVYFVYRVMRKLDINIGY